MSMTGMSHLWLRRGAVLSRFGAACVRCRPCRRRDGSDRPAYGERTISRVLKSDPATGRRRSSASREAILDATHLLLEEVGFEKLSIEGIAARAGVGKATIYRWWSNKGGLAMESFLRAVAPKIAFPKTESAGNDLMQQIEKVAQVYNGKSGKIVREMIALGQSNADTMHLFVDGYLEPRRSAAREVIKRGIDQHEFTETCDLEIVVDALYGPIFHRMLTKHAAIDAAFVRAHVTLILNGLAT